ncbi:MAG: TIGR02444 family protein [Oceanicoccus sp.]|uniref:TIGR02444 family protein n=1 Tax=Oceanicoccus sp. TaxID=2691044 RepID=UPI00262351F2|nr:TIGR02444 family protein [Oceanicoccus sp.]MCP3907402.1 TIGR02444 family protein [Oceanicoccus sp.]MDG1772414.1 TIGR02444 family protein [Oceanicoccus sp.]
MQDNPLWQYSLAVYNRPGVESLMIMLQDSYQADVNMLLCCGWLGREGQQLSLDSMRLLVDVSMPWQQHCVQPLRAVRRFLKGKEDEAFRDQVKALEIAAEQRQQAMIYQQLQSLNLLTADPATAVGENLSLYGTLLNPANQHGLSQSLADLVELMRS